MIRARLHTFIIIVALAAILGACAARNKPGDRLLNQTSLSNGR